MHRAKVNMVVCAKALLNVARKMQTTYNVPFFEATCLSSMARTG